MLGCWYATGRPDKLKASKRRENAYDIRREAAIPPAESRQAVSRWERDETMPETDKVVALADIFGVTTDYLLRLQLEQTKPEEKQPPPQERKDWVERFLTFSKRKWYLLGWVLIAWGVLDLVQLALFYLAYRGMLGGFTGLIGWDMAEMGGVNLLDVFPAGVLLFPALYAAVKIAAGVLVLYFGKRHVQKKREEEMQ